MSTLLTKNISSLDGTPILFESGIEFLPLGTGAVPSDVQHKLREHVSVSDFGAIGNGITDDTDSIQAAIDYCSLLGKVLDIGSGVYLLRKRSATTDAAGIIYPCLIMKSNMHIKASPNAVFKLDNLQSVDATPINICMFFSGVPLINMSIVGLTVDMNGENNYIGLTTPTFAHILFSSNTARGENVVIDQCIFKNTPGKTCIAMGQTTGEFANVLSSKWTITNCVFENNGSRVHDHSSIYGWGNDVLVSGNKFYKDNATYFAGSWPVAYEVHGASQKFTNNTVSNYYQGMWIAANYTSDCDNIIVSENVFSPIRGVGIDFFREGVNDSIIRKVLICNNTIGLDDNTVGIDQKVGIQVNSAYKIENVLISNNIVSKIGTTTPSAGAVIGTRTIASQIHNDIKLSNNKFISTVSGVYISNPTVPLGNIIVENNLYSNLTPAGTFLSPAGTSVDSLAGIQYLSLSNNKCVDNRNTPLCKYGEYITGVIGILHKTTPANRQMTIADSLEVSLTVTKRVGDHNNILYTPTWSDGTTAVTAGNGTLNGITTYHGKRVSLTTQLTVGSTTSFPGGALRISLPVAATTTTSSYLGTWRIFDSSAIIFKFGWMEADASGLVATFQVDSGLFVANGTPIIFAVGDQIFANIEYNTD